MTEVARSAAEGVAAGRAQRAVTLGQSAATEVARSAAEGAAAGVRGHSPRKILRFLHFIYTTHQALLVLENSFQISFLQPKSLQFSKQTCNFKNISSHFR